MGKPTVFVRLTGCPLRCQYCDTAYAFSGGSLRNLEDIVDEVVSYKPRYITVTGGEPLGQANCLNLLSRLCDLNAEVSLETSGALDVGAVDERINIVMDVKTPGSGEVDRNNYANIQKLKPSDQIKFVICDRKDYEWARFKIDELSLADRFDEILLSPSQTELEARTLADWMLEDHLHARLQIQLHKLLWNDVASR